MNTFIGLGVAGNFTEHLEQAGEADDFTAVTADSAEAPKGIFPWYVPNVGNFLSVDPLSSTTLDIPAGIKVQAEPELVLICDITYDEDKVTGLTPIRFGAFNDASLRTAKPKISLKKNWGVDSHGMSAQTLPIDSFTSQGVLNSFVLGSWLQRNGKWQQYGEASEVRYYSYFYRQLLDWLLHKMNTQHDHGPLENIADLLKVAGYPAQAYIAVGATRYTPFGENTYLQPGDEIVVVLFEEQFSTEHILAKLSKDELEQTASCVYLRQKVQ